MRKVTLGILGLCGLLALGIAGSVMANSAVDGDDPAMMASPQTIVLAKVSDITVHTNIPLSTVAPASVMLDGVAASGVWADSLGHLVARFRIADLELLPGEVTLMLTGLFDDGSAFAAADAVTVK
ncbi:MAG: hypothetical protein JXR77_14525 [Lentisphaeria bacterium]|nr:hypothetical protein [Lentisphaeria bacterium]